MLAVYRRIPLVDQALPKGQWLAREMRSVARQRKGKTVGLVTPQRSAVAVDNVAEATIHVFQGFQKFLRGKPLPAEDLVA
jgi:hypothetical protein